MALELSRRRFTVEEFHRMGLSGILREKDHVELIRGEIIEMPPIGSEHAADVTGLDRQLTLRLGERAVVRVQNPIVLTDDTEPEPDIAVARWRDDQYRSAHPGAADVLLVIEVADTSLAYDREVKLPAYAAAGIPEAWIVDVKARVLEVHRNPRPDGYALTMRLGAGERVALLAFPEVEFELKALLV